MTFEENTDKSQLIREIEDLSEIYWQNNKLKKFSNLDFHVSFEEIVSAEERLDRFSSFLAVAFKEEAFDGIIESPIKKIDCIEKIIDQKIIGDVYLKCDHLLPIAGSVKARGGVYEVLKYAEDLLIENNLLKIEDDYSVLLDKKYKTFFSDYTITVGSTGNLGLSIGIISKALGFNCVVHMSKEAQHWKKELLRSKGVKVIEHQSDYSEAVLKGRKAAENEPNNYFVDDEKSLDLFLGYTVAGLRLKKQLVKQKIEVSKEKPLNVYIPCGVGGAPSGIAYGLKYMFKDYLNVYFIEPTHAPCVTISMVTGLGNEVSVGDLGLDNKTIADGLAVGRASALACKTMENILTGCITISDEKLYKYLGRSYDLLDEKLEPSATAGFEGLKYNHQKGTHIVWATGGRLMPEDVFNDYLDEYKKLEEDIFIDFLYLDLTTCDRCQDADRKLEEGIDAIREKFPEKNIYLNKVNVNTKALAYKCSFVTSPTIRVNGIDLQEEIVEDDCIACGELCGDQVDCRVWTYEGIEYHEPPTQMIVKEMTRIITEKPWKTKQKNKNYSLPENLEKFYDQVERNKNIIRI